MIFVRRRDSRHRPPLQRFDFQILDLDRHMPSPDEVRTPSETRVVEVGRPRACSS